MNNEENMNEENTIEDNGKTKKTKEFSLLREIWEWVYTLAIAIIVAMLIKGFVFDIVRVDGSSMFPTLVDNDRLIVTKLGYAPKQGDIIILDSEYKNREEYYKQVATINGDSDFGFFDKLAARKDMPSNLKKKYYVKRIIAMPGQTIDLVDGNVYVDGEKLNEEYYDGITSSIDPTVEYPITVDDNCVFVMGDNRTRSKDSRSSELGQVPFEAILGKSQVRIWPLNAISKTK